MTRRATPREPHNADYDALFELAAAAMLELDAAGVVRRMNPAAARLLSCDPRSSIGTALDALLGTDVTPVLGAEAPVDIQARTDQGTQSMTLRSMRRSLHASDGDRFVIQLTPAASTVESQDRDRRRGSALHWSMMDDVSHNLGTPLGIIAGYAETLSTQLAQLSPDEVTNAAAAIHRHAARAVDELHALQARVRLTSGGAGTVPTSVLLAWLRRMLEANLVGNDAVLVGTASTDIVTIDVAVARQALLNMCTLALHTTPTPRVLEIEVERDGAGTAFTLRTDPASVAGPDEARFTIEATRSLVEAHGGRSSAPSPQDPYHRLWLPSTSHRALGETTPTIPVAVIEDDVDTAALIRASLRNSSTVFDIVADERTFEQGLAAVARTQPRIVLLDQNLPDRTGTAGLADLRALVPGATVVVLSVRGPRDDDDVVEGTVWLEKGRVLADLGSELIGVLATGD